MQNFIGISYLDYIFVANALAEIIREKLVDIFNYRIDTLIGSGTILQKPGVGPFMGGNWPGELSRKGVRQETTIIYVEICLENDESGVVEFFLNNKGDVYIIVTDYQKTELDPVFDRNRTGNRVAMKINDITASIDIFSKICDLIIEKGDQGEIYTHRTSLLQKTEDRELVSFISI
jgi:transcription elongation factor Elf1